MTTSQIVSSQPQYLSLPWQLRCPWFLPEELISRLETTVCDNQCREEVSGADGE